jgi:biopolymer transport protein ExbB
MKRILPLTLFAILLAPLGPASAESFDEAQKTMDRRLNQALEELGRVRGQIAEEKIPLSKAVSGLENEVLTLRRKRDGLLKIRDSRTIDLTSLRRQVESLGEQDEFIDSRLDEFVRDFEARLDISELPRFEELTAAATLAEKNVNVDAGSKRDAQLEVVRAALGRLREQLGGQVFPGEALSPEGVLSEGTFIAFGPTFFYASNDGSVTGLVENQLNAADPVVVPLPMRVDFREIVETGRGTLPFDATLGKALKVEKARKSLRQYVDDGGVVGYVIVALGLSALLLTLFKMIEILGFDVAPPEKVDGVLDALANGDQDAAAQRARGVKGVVGEMLTTGVEHADERRGVLEELLFEAVLRVRPALERFLPFLAITAAAAPLLGLLGTVTGMIKTFQLITIFGTGDAKSLSSGISEALVTTAMGLIVAIPTLILHGALSRMAKRKLGMLEEISVAFVNGLAAVRAAAAPRARADG